MSKLSSTYDKFKTVIKKYWYIAIPVHMGTSVTWFGSFYGLTKAGLDVLPLLEKTSLPEHYIAPLKKGNVGYVAQAAVLYKIATPFRYASTLYVTRSVIRQLKKRDLIK